MVENFPLRAALGSSEVWQSPKVKMCEAKQEHHTVSEPLT